MKVLVLGASGMIGSAIFRVLGRDSNLNVTGCIRGDGFVRFFSDAEQKRLVFCKDIQNQNQLIRLFGQIKPDIVINCIGLTKHHQEVNDPTLAISINALLPHCLSELCDLIHARLIHISTDCVFSGVGTPEGGYREGDGSDAIDVYGKSKFLGEVTTEPHVVTLRTSTIGHELQSSYGLLEWFLSQGATCVGYKKAIFSGLPSTVFAEIIRDHVIPRSELHGLYHIGALPINKYDLLKLISAEYRKKVNISCDSQFSIDRALNVDRFGLITGYRAPSWSDLIHSMHEFHEALNV